MYITGKLLQGDEETPSDLVKPNKKTMPTCMTTDSFSYQVALS